MDFMDSNAQIASWQEITPYLRLLRVKPVGWQLPDFQPGQFARLGLPDTNGQMVADADPKASILWRSYSITSPPKQKDYLEFYLNRVDTGTFTPRLFGMSAGDRLHLSPRIEGRLTLEGVAPEQQLILAATGTGIGPFISMLRSGLLENRTASSVVLHGVRHITDLTFGKELEKLTADYPLFHYLPLVSRPEDPNWSGQIGHIQSLWKDRSEKTHKAPIDYLLHNQPTPDNTHVFLCGNPAMITEMLAILEQASFQRHHPRKGGQVHMEKYW